MFCSFGNFPSGLIIRKIFGVLNTCYSIRVPNQIEHYSARFSNIRIPQQRSLPRRRYMYIYFEDSAGKLETHKRSSISFVFFLYLAPGIITQQKTSSRRHALASNLSYIHLIKKGIKQNLSGIHPCNLVLNLKPDILCAKFASKAYHCVQEKVVFIHVSYEVH